MDDSLALILIMCGSFVAVPLCIQLVRTYRKHFPATRKKKRTLRQRLEQYLFHETLIGTVLDVTQVILSLISCGVYVAETYLDDDSDAPYAPAFFIIEVTLTSIFGLDYCLRFYLAKDKWLYYFSMFAVISDLEVEIVVQEVERVVGKDICCKLLRIFQGSTTDVSKLMEAGMDKCSVAVVLAVEEFFETGLGDVLDDFLQDTDAVATFNLLQAYAPTAFVVIELQDTNSCVLLNDKVVAKSLMRQELPRTAASSLPELVRCNEFKCGAVFVPALVHMLLVQALTVPSLVKLFKEMLPRLEIGTVHLPFEQVLNPDPSTMLKKGDYAFAVRMRVEEPAL